MQDGGKVDGSGDQGDPAAAAGEGDGGDRACGRDRQQRRERHLGNHRRIGTWVKCWFQ